MENKDLRNLLCGGVAGCVSRTAVAPLERLKILYQVQDVLRSSSASTGSIASNTKYQGMWQSLRRIGAEEGMRGYFKGNGANCVRIFPYTAIQFAVFARIQPLLLREGETRVTPIRKLLGGAVAGIVSVGVTYPLDFVRARLTVQGGLSTTQYTGIADALRGIIRTEGFRGLYRGITPTVIGVAPYVGLNFMVFETLRASAPLDQNGKPSTFFLLGCGAVAGACGQAAAYPMDLLRRRFQVSGLQGNGGASAAAYRSTFGGLKWIVQTEGFRGLYKGLAPNFVKVVPSIAVMFTTNELLQRAIDSYTRQAQETRHEAL